MPLDASRLGQVTAALMETLDSSDEDAELGEVMVLAEVRGRDDDGPYSYIAWRCSDERHWVQRGLLHAALENERLVDEDDPGRTDPEA